MWSSTIVVAVAAAILLFLWVTGVLCTKNHQGLPPGLNLLSLWSHHVHGRVNMGDHFSKSLVDLARIYGKTFTITLMNTHIVIINDWANMKEALMKKTAIFSDRPDNFTMDLMLNNTDIVNSKFPIWKEKRRFTLHSLRTLGFGKASMESQILNEVQEMTAAMGMYDGKEMKINEFFLIPVLNVLWRIVASKTFEYEDKDIIATIKNAIKGLHSAGSTLPVNICWILYYLPGDLFSVHKITDIIHHMGEFFGRDIDEHRRTFQKENHRDFIDIFVSKILQQETVTTDTEENLYQKEHLIGIMGDLLVAGVETTSSTLEWSLMFMALCPELQQKVQKELDEVIGKHRLPSIQDLPMLTYTEATIMEVLRYAPVIPLSFHAARCSTTIAEHTIPKGTYVYGNIWGVHHDKDLWGDPQVFRPERFISDDGKIEKPEYLIPFSIEKLASGLTTTFGRAKARLGSKITRPERGSRACLGESLARLNVFLFFASIMQRFTFRCAAGKKPPDMLNPNQDISLRPKPFSLMVQHRI